VTRSRPAGIRRGSTHPLAALLALAVAAVTLALAGWSAAGWAVLGGLAGFTLSGSV
jgi:hypothetical protein